MAARLCPDNVRQSHQSLHHIVAHAPWSDDDILDAVRRYAVPAMENQGPIVAWIVDDTGFVKKGTHSVGVARQYCGQVGKQENCRVAVSLSISTMQASLPIAWRLAGEQGGTVRLDPTPMPEPTRFVLTLPRMPAPGPAPLPLDPAATPSPFVPPFPDVTANGRH